VTGRSHQQQHASEFFRDSQKLLEMRMVGVRMSIESAASDLISAKNTSCEFSLRPGKGGENELVSDDRNVEASRSEAKLCHCKVVPRSCR